MHHVRRSALALILGLSPFLTGAADVPSPESHLGFRPGADFHLAPWETVVDYFRKVDAASDRVRVRELGKTTEGRPYIVAIVASPETMGQLDRYRRLQHRLADPRLDEKSSESGNPVEDSKVVVLITCSIHSTETASTLMAMELLHDLATKDDPATREVLDRTILLLVPSANPDGVEKVARWYERSKGKPWEGSGMVELYHKYAGHDTNRDWFMLNLVETRLLTHFLYKEWFPTLTYDVHQMGTRGARLFVPPFYDPINPNLDPRIHQSIALIGAHMAADLADAGKRGVLTHAMYDNWWNGGNRTTPQRHNMVGVLTEAASVKMASPLFLEREQLNATTRGFPNQKPAINFVEPWPGGWWRLRDIVDYELICARSLLTLAARYRTMFQANYRAMARDAIDKGKNEPPFAWVVPSDQRDPGTAAEMVRILHDTGIEVRRARSSFKAEGVSYPAGSWIMLAAQPYRAHLKDMMERQVYPARFAADGTAEPPYDVAGWTLSLQMGVRVVAIAEPFEAEADPSEALERPSGEVVGAGQLTYYASRNQSNADFILLNALLKAGVEVQVARGDVAVGRAEDREKKARGTPEGGGVVPTGGFLFPNAPDDDRLRVVFRETLAAAPVLVSGLAGEIDGADAKKLRPIARQRIGVYQPWVPSMDEGWTRLVLEKFHFPYETLHNADIRAGDLKGRIDTLLIPSIDVKTLRDGYARDETEPAYVGGLGPEGAAALREFVREGGTLVCLEAACHWAIDELDLPVTDVLKGLPTSTFYGPGSIVHITMTPGHPLAIGMPDDGSAYFDRSLAFDVRDNQAQVAARYGGAGVLESGWLLGEDKLRGKAALVEVPRGKGRVVLFGFPPQHRGQTHGTFRLLLNALLRGGLPDHLQPRG